MMIIEQPINYVIGVDCGANIVPAVLIDVAGSGELASSVYMYPRWAQGLCCEALENRFGDHLMIGDETRLPEFRKEILWNDRAYRP